MSREYFFPQRKNPDRSPRRDDERDRERPAHRRARADRNRPHVWPHQSAHKRHRQHRGNDGEGREDSRVADFADRFDRDRGPVAAFVLREMKMADDVFHHHDRVIDQDADGEDEREERDAIERESEQVKNEQGERERGGDGERDDGRFAPAEREPDEKRHADNGEAHVKQEFVRFFRRRLAVVARDRNFDIARDERAL